MSTQFMSTPIGESAQPAYGEPSIPRIIHFTIPKEASEQQLKNIEIARKLHPDWEIKVWQDPVDPQPFRLSKYWSKANSGAQLADLIRLEVVLNHGGFYVDSDIVLHRSLEPLRNYNFVVASEDGIALTNAFFGAVKECPALAQIVGTLDVNEVDWRLPPDVSTGPALLARELKWRDDVTVIPRQTFYPYNFNEAPRPAHRWTYGTHEWSFSWSSVTGLHRPLRPLVRKLRKWRKSFQVWSRIKIRYFFLHLRELLRVDSPNPFSASGVICAQTAHGPKIFLAGEDVTITPDIALRGTYEFREERFIARVVQHGDWVIDVGANVGIMSLIAATRVRSFGRVFAYEPNPLPASLLKKSLVMNWLHDRTIVREKALGSHPGTMQLHFNSGLLGGATLAEQDGADTFDRSVSLLTGTESIDVEVSTLDAEFPVDLPIRLLKIDAEGFEHEVLRGGARLLERQCVDLIMMECLQEVCGKNWNSLLAEVQKLMEFGYRPHALAWSSKLREITMRQIWAPDRGRNIVFVSEHAKSTVR